MAGECQRHPRTSQEESTCCACKTQSSRASLALGSCLVLCSMCQEGKMLRFKTSSKFCHERERQLRLDGKKEHIRKCVMASGKSETMEPYENILAHHRQAHCTQNAQRHLRRDINNELKTTNTARTPSWPLEILHSNSPRVKGK